MFLPNLLVRPVRAHHLLRWSRKDGNSDSFWQVNHSPSFTTDSSLDREVKDALLCDAMTLVNLRGCDKRKVMEEDKRRVKERLFQCHQQPRESRCSRCLICLVANLCLLLLSWDSLKKGKTRDGGKRRKAD